MDGCNILEDNDISTIVIVTETLRDSNWHQDVGCVHAIRFELVEDFFLEHCWLPDPDETNGFLYALEQGHALTTCI